jgi:hypothetical protein
MRDLDNAGLNVMARNELAKKAAENPKTPTIEAIEIGYALLSITEIRPGVFHADCPLLKLGGGWDFSNDRFRSSDRGSSKEFPFWRRS